MKVIPEAPVAVVKALEHVRLRFPDVTHVLYTREGKWLYLDDDGHAPSFHGAKTWAVDLGILEDGADSAPHFPIAYCVEEEQVS